MIHKIPKLYDRQFRNFRNIFIGNRYCQRLPFQTFAAALAARCNHHKVFILLTGNFRASLPVTPFHIPDKPFKGDIINAFAPHTFIVNPDFLALCSVNQNIMNLLGIILKRRVQRKIVMLRQSLQNRIGKASGGIGGLPSQNSNGTLIDTQRWVRNH